MDMTSDAGLASQDTDYTKDIQEVLDELQQMQQTPRLVTNPDELEALEREIRRRTDHLGSLLVGAHLQQALVSFPRFNATGLTNYQTLTRIFVQALPRLATSFVTIGLVFTRIHAIGFGKN